MNLTKLLKPDHASVVRAAHDEATCAGALRYAPRADGPIRQSVVLFFWVVLGVLAAPFVLFKRLLTGRGL